MLFYDGGDDMKIVTLVAVILSLLAGLVSLSVSLMEYKEKRPNALTSVNLSEIN